jgi:hypothetical protein
LGATCSIRTTYPTERLNQLHICNVRQHQHICAQPVLLIIGSSGMCRSSLTDSSKVNIITPPTHNAQPLLWFPKAQAPSLLGPRGSGGGIVNKGKKREEVEGELNRERGRPLHPMEEQLSTAALERIPKISHHAVVAGCVAESGLAADVEVSQVEAAVRHFEQVTGRRPRILIAKMGQDGHDRWDHEPIICAPCSTVTACSPVCATCACQCQLADLGRLCTGQHERGPPACVPVQWCA